MRVTDAQIRRAVDAGLKRATPQRFWDAFNESDHPRKGGKFTSKGAGGGKGQTGSHEVDGLPYTTHQNAIQKKSGQEEVRRYGHSVGVVQKHGNDYHAVERKNDGSSRSAGKHASREAALVALHHATGGDEHAKAHKE